MTTNHNILQHIVMHITTNLSTVTRLMKKQYFNKMSNYIQVDQHHGHSITRYVDLQMLPTCFTVLHFYTQQLIQPSTLLYYKTQLLYLLVLFCNSKYFILMKSGNILIILYPRLNLELNQSQLNLITTIHSFNANSSINMR